MRRHNQLALDLFPKDGSPPYPDDPTAAIVSVSGGLDSDYAALWARRRWPDRPIILPTEDGRRQREAALQQRIGANIRAARLARAVSQEELAAALKIERPSLSRYERGERSIPLSILLDIAAILNTPLEQLLNAERGADRPTLSLPAAIGQQAELSRIIERLSRRPVTPCWPPSSSGLITDACL